MAFTAMDVLGTGDSRWLKFAGIALCFVVSALLSARGGEVLVTVAVGLSAAADILLLIMDAHYAVGVMLFFVAQILYFVRIYRANGHKSAWPLRLFLFMAAVAVMAQFGLLSPLDLLAGAYFSFFACNVMQAWRTSCFLRDLVCSYAAIYAWGFITCRRLCPIGCKAPRASECGHSICRRR